MNAYYYLNDAKEPQGPHTRDELRAMLAVGTLTESTLAARQGDNGWQPLAALLSTAEKSQGAATAGTCPDCGKKLPLVGDQLPQQCPKCGYCLRPETPTNLWQNFVLALRKTCVWKGRATRTEYWSFFLFSYLAQMATRVVLQIAVVSIGLSSHEPSFLSTGFSVCLALVAFLFMVALMWLTIAQISVTIRRFHDVGFSGFWLLGFVPLIIAAFSLMITSMVLGVENIEIVPTPLTLILGMLIYLGYGVFFFVLTVKDSNRGPNRFGPSSKYPTI